MRAACIGECMVELRPLGDGTYARGFAGDAYNTAVYLKRELGAQGEVALVTALGDEGLSAAMRAAFRAERVDDRLAFTVNGGAVGLYMIELDEAGERTFLYWRGASAARGWMRELESAGGAEALVGVDLVYLSGVSLAILSDADRERALELLRELRGRVRRIAFDPNVRLRLWPDARSAACAVEAAAASADIVLPSAQDGELLWGERDPQAQLARWLSLGPPEVAMTLAADGARVAWPGGEAAVAPQPAAAVVDTSGAGDSFNGAYLAARLRGEPPPAAAAHGMRLASHVVGLSGAIVAA